MRTQGDTAPSRATRDGAAAPRPPGAPARGVAPHTYAPRSLLWLLAPLLLAAAGLAAYLARGRTATSGSVAIVPFAVDGSETGTGVLADGIRETITEALGHLPRLRVIAAGSMARYRPGSDPREVGRELGVRTVVTGRVVQQGEMLAVSTELVSAADGARLWGDTSVRPISDILDVRDGIAAEIAQRLRPGLSAAERMLLRPRHTRDVATFQLYLMGRHHRKQRTPQGLEDAIACFKQAVAADPRYALACAGLADCYALLGTAEYGAVPPRDAFPQARAAASRALEIDPLLAEAHASLGFVQWSFDRDRAAAERSLRRAIELAPGYALPHRWYAEMLAEGGRLREADGEIRRALDLDPLSPAVGADLGRFAGYARDWDRAIEFYTAAVALEPGFVPAQIGLALTHGQERRFTEALARVDQADRAAPGEPGVLAARGWVLGRAGRGAEARAAAEELQRHSAQRYVPAYYVGEVLLGAGDADGAFAWMAKACDERSPLLGTLGVDPAFDPIRGDPRFAALLRCAGLDR